MGWHVMSLSVPLAYPFLLVAKGGSHPAGVNCRGRGGDHSKEAEHLRPICTSRETLWLWLSFKAREGLEPGV